MYHIDRVFGSRISTTQFLLHPPGMARVAEHDRDGLNRWTAGDEFSDRFHWCNAIAELAIVLEPLAYSTVFHEIRMRSLQTEETVEAARARHADLCRPLLQGLTVAQLNEVRAQLCRDAELLDGNTTLHVLLRLMATQERKRLGGDIGGCVLLWCMAEMIRRPVEAELNVLLPEEDEVGHQWFEGAREVLYGTTRVFDNERHPARFPQPARVRPWAQGALLRRGRYRTRRADVRVRWESARH